MIAIGKIPFLSTEDQERVERVLGESLEIVPFDEANGDDFSEKIHQIMQEILGKTKHELMTYTYPAPNSEDEEEKKEIRFLQVEPKAGRRKNWDSTRSMLQQAAFAPVVLMRISD